MKTKKIFIKFCAIAFLTACQQIAVLEVPRQDTASPQIPSMTEIHFDSLPQAIIGGTVPNMLDWAHNLISYYPLEESHILNSFHFWSNNGIK